MKWLNQRLFFRLLISFLATILIGFAIIGVVISISTTDYITYQKRQEMLQQARSINGVLHQDSGVVTKETIRTIEQLAEFIDSNIWLINENEEIVATSTTNELLVDDLINKEIMAEVLDGGHNIQVIDMEEENQPMLSVIVPWGTNEEIYGGIILHAPISGINTTVRNIREIILWAIVAGLAIAALLVSYLSWTISKPLKRVEEAANEIALGNYNKRVEHDSPDEMGALVKSFNRMAEKLDRIEKERGSLEQRRKDFISNISHELRTPLTAMKGFLEALQDGLVKDKESQQRYYRIMYRETEYLNHLVNDLMDLMKLEEKEISLDLYYIQIEDLLKKIALDLEPAIDEKENELTIEAINKIPPIIGDSIRLEQIFKNLIHNANNFTDNGTITITLEATKKDVQISVADSGIGIPSHDLNRIWERFFKVDRVRQKNERGTGLGLAIVKELVALHKGTISVTSKLGEGTTFHISLPIDLSTYPKQ